MSWGAAHEQDDIGMADGDLSPVLDRVGREQLRTVLGLPNERSEAVRAPQFPAAVPEPPLDESDLVDDEEPRDEWDEQSLAARVATLSIALADIDRKLDRLLDTRRVVDEVREQVERMSRQLFG